MFRKTLLTVVLLGVLSLANQSWACGGCGGGFCLSFGTPRPAPVSPVGLDRLSGTDLLNARQNAYLYVAEQLPKRMASMVSYTTPQNSEPHGPTP